LKAQTVAIFSYIDPIVAIILSAVLLNESMDMYSIIGAVLVLGSTFVSELAERK
jgi:drug/metabolite transporter (DMT)-like permease